MNKYKNKPSSDLDLDSDLKSESRSKLISDLSDEYMRIVCSSKFSRIINNIHQHSFRFEKGNTYISHTLNKILNSNMGRDGIIVDRPIMMNGRTYGRRSSRQFSYDSSISKIKNVLLSGGITNGSCIVSRDLISEFNISRNIGYNHLSVSEDGNYITYIPYNKKYKLEWLSGDYRIKVEKQKVKIGKFIKSVFNSLGSNLSNSQIERFVSIFKSYSTNNGSFEEIKGEKIKETFKNENLVKSSTLANSCMNGKPSSRFDLYSKNPDKVSMLIFKNNNLIKGRALLWKLDDGRTYMDRVYYSDEHIDYEFQKYGRKHDYLIYHDRGRFALKVTLKNYTFESYPYLDTVQFFSILTGVFTDTLGILREEKPLPKSFIEKTYLKVFRNKKYKKLKSLKNNYMKQSRLTGGSLVDVH